MDWVSSEFVSVIYYLLPGFVAAWVFYGLTAHPKASPFERVLQALIFTVIVQAFVAVVRWILCVVGKVVCFGSWSPECTLVWSVVLAVAIGFVFAWLANTDCCHKLLRKWKITSRTSFPSEWFSAFHREKRWVILNLSGGRRLYGWPEEWPDYSDSGHFVIDQPEWLLDDEERVPLYRTVGKIVVPAADVEMIELLRTDAEIEVEPVTMKMAADLPEQTNKRENDHGSQGPTTSPK